MFEYVVVTKSENDKLDCLGLLTNKVYKEVEVLQQHGVDSPPQVDDRGLVMTVGSSEYVWIGNLQQFISGLQTMEMRVHPKNKTGIFFSGDNLQDQEVEIYRADIDYVGDQPNQSIDYRPSERIRITKDGEIYIERIDSVTQAVKSQIHMKNDDTIDVTATTINLN